MRSNGSAAVKAIAFRWLVRLPGVLVPMLASFVGIGVRFLIPPGGLTAWGNVKPGSRSGFSLSMRYRVQKLVSTLSCMRFVSRFFPEDPVAVLPGNARK